MFAADKVPAGEPPPPDDVDPDLAAAQAELAAEAEAKKAEEDEAVRLAAEEDGETDDEREARETAEAEAQKLEDEAKVAKPLTDDELRAEAIKRGLLKEEPAEAVDETIPPVVTDYRTPAYKEAWGYPQFVETDEFGNKTLNDAGISWAENKAIQDGVQATLAQTRHDEATRNLQAAKPQLVAKYTEDAKGLGIPDDVAPAIAKDFVDIMTNYGLAAFDEGESDSDPKVKEAKKAQAQGLQRTAYYVALGMQSEREMQARKEGGDEGDKPTGAVDRSKGSAGGGLYEGLSKEDVDWVKAEWIPKKNGGKPPTRAQILDLKERVLA